MTTRTAPCIPLSVVCLLVTLVCAAGSSVADVTSGTQLPAATVSYSTSEAERITTAVSYVDLPEARGAFTTRQAGGP